uniref:Cytochrome c oxidase subunit 2 n=1 Tax=Caulobothrium sp. LRP 10376 TaxID=2899467 RepID=A0A8K1SWP5_9CEST|nr:cytochrome c oxidase subunit II [Caulobothrium sp. LRP 10376]
MNILIIYYDIVCYVVAICIFILCFVYFMLYWNFFSRGSINFGADNQAIELIWTVIPTIIVLVLCSLNVNFITGGLDCSSDKTIKLVGHQWYWSYDYAEGSYDSFVTSDCFRTDKPLRLMHGVSYNLITTSADVIHSFSVPALNLKMDAIPGRLNYLNYTPSQFGVFTGYCTELCGAGHGFMPIIVEVVK